MILGLFSRAAVAQYPWPAKPFNQQHWINGTFCENRPSGSVLRHHFHDGVDMHLPQGNPVYSVIDGSVTSLSRGGTPYIRVGRYAYVHVVPAPNLQVGDPVTAFETIIGVTDQQNHVHFKDGYPGSEINPLRPGGLSPFEDLLKPNVKTIEFFIHGSENRFEDRVVSGPVDIVARAMDTTDNGPLGSNNGVYKIGYQILTADGATSLVGPKIAFRFDQKPSNQYITNVYAPGSDLSTYRYYVTNRLTRKEYWDTSTLPPGDYLVKVFTEDTRNNTDTTTVRVTVVEPDTTPPAPPVVTRVVGDSSGAFGIYWKASTEQDLRGYRLYFSLDGQRWTQRLDEEDLDAAATEATFPSFPAGTDIYFRLSAVDRAPFPNESLPSDTYGMQITTTRPKALIVDGFDRTDGAWQSPRHDFVIPYGVALNAAGIGFDVATDDAVRLGLVNLDDYDLALYLLGDEQSPDTVFTVEEKQRLRRFLRGGGALLISAARAASDLAQSDSTFLREVLKVDYVGDHIGNEAVRGVSGSLFEGLELNLDDGAYVLPFADVLEGAGSEAVLRTGAGEVVGTAYQGPIDEGAATTRILLWAFPFEIATPEEARLELMQRAVAFFFPTTQVAEGRTEQPSVAPTLLPNSPNPFNQETEIRYRLGHAADVKLTVYNSNGQLVQVLERGRRPAGLHSIRWQGRNGQGAQVASGVYYVKLATGRTEVVRPVVLMR
jgi:hypothetical protein